MCCNWVIIFLSCRLKKKLRRKCRSDSGSDMRTLETNCKADFEPEKTMHFFDSGGFACLNYSYSLNWSQQSGGKINLAAWYKYSKCNLGSYRFKQLWTLLSTHPYRFVGNEGNQLKLNVWVSISYLNLSGKNTLVLIRNKFSAYLNRIKLPN